jgi:hypothetical protein
VIVFTPFSIYTFGYFIHNKCEIFMKDIRIPLHADVGAGPCACPDAVSACPETKRSFRKGHPQGDAPTN